jgi:penicillin G amidase
VRLVIGLVRLLIVLVVVVALLAGLLLGWVVVRAFPQRTGTATVPDLQAAVTVIRDANGIPQIYASTSADLFMAEGYLHASERMWQMEVWRHISSGTLSELFGKSEVKTDEFIRTLGWHQSAVRDYAAASPAARAALDAYAKGVNAWLATHTMGSLPFVVAGFLGAGGGLSGYKPKPWSAVDSVAWAKVEAWQLGGNMDTEIFNLLLSAKVDPAAIQELSPPYPSDMPVIVPTGAPGSGGAGATGQSTAPDPAVVASADSSAVQQDLLALMNLSDGIGALTGLGPTSSATASGGVGSNDWVVSGAHTASGSPMLANDPHLAHSMPSLWYMVGLHCQPVSSACPYDVTGVSFPGDPGVVLGHNAKIAWGFTNVNPDVEDLFVERVDPNDPKKYEYKGQMLPFQTRTETIDVAGGAPVTYTVRSTVHGAVISDVENDLKPASAGGGGLAGTGVVYALRWTATAAVGHVLDAILQLDQATDFTTFRAALADFDAPSQNVVYADVNGHIGYQMPGLIPIRKAGDGSVPVPGWTGAYDWTGYVPQNQLPYLYDPPSGIIATANNATVDSRFPVFIGKDWDLGYRAERILQLLQTKPKLTQTDMTAIQADTRMGLADDVVPALAGAQPATEDGKTVLQQIQAWDRTCPTDSTGCAAFNVFVYHLLRDVFDPRLGGGTAKTDIARLFVGTSRSAAALVSLLSQPNSRWWQDPSASTPRTMDQVIANALDQAGADLRKQLGDPASWTWGAIHTVTFQEQTLGTSGIGPLEWLLDKGPYPVAGGPFQVDQTYVDLSVAYPDPYTAGSTGTSDLKTIFANLGGPSYRLVVDMSALDKATIINTTGESGLPFDSHYGDLIADWLAVKPVPLPFTRTAVEAAGTQTLTLQP